MNLLDAIRSGKRFRVPRMAINDFSEMQWYPAHKGRIDYSVVFKECDLLSEEWEVEKGKLQGWIRSDGFVLCSDTKPEGNNGTKEWIRAPWLDEP